MNRIITCLLLSAVAICATSAFAGPLTTDPDAYFDGSFTWRGSTTFQGYDDYPGTTQPSELYGYIDWAVFAPGDFPAGYLGYAPTPGEFVYTYQAYTLGAAPLTGVAVRLEAIADNIGSFTGDNSGNGLVSGTLPSLAYFFPDAITPISANWDTFPGIEAVLVDVTPGVSSGYAFSSPFGPKFLDGSVIDDGSIGDVIPLPSPDPEYIPEPGTMTLAGCGLVVFAVQWLRRRGRRAVA